MAIVIFTLNFFRNCYKTVFVYCRTDAELEFLNVLKVFGGKFENKVIKHSKQFGVVLLKKFANSIFVSVSLVYFM